MSGNKVAQYVHKYPALSDGKVDLRGKRSRSGQERVYGEVKRLVESGLSCIEIAKNRGITRQAVHDYLRHHPELKEPLEERKNDF
jgi:DNA invertase Pin-like site-specific DNA recombinase